MQTSEITIAVLLGIIIIVSSIYLVYFEHDNCKKYLDFAKENHEERLPVIGKTPKIIGGLLLGLLFAFSLFGFVTTLIYRTSPLIGNSYYISVVSDSMSSKNSKNTYLLENDLNNQIAQYDIAEVERCSSSMVNIYDVILYKKDNTLIIHRVIKINDDNTFVTRGDKNDANDEWVVTNDMFIGIYKKSLPFMSFINYLTYTPGFYILLGGTTFDIGVLLVYEIKRNNIKKKYINITNA